MNGAIAVIAIGVIGMTLMACEPTVQISPFSGGTGSTPPQPSASPSPKAMAPTASPQPAKPRPTPAAKPKIPTPSPSVTPLMLPGEDPIALAQDKAISAENVAQTAQTPEDWDLVTRQWQQAIALLKAVPKSNPAYGTAQTAIRTYQSALTAAQQRRQTSGTVPVRQFRPVTIAAANPESSAAPDARASVQTLNQKQIEFFAKEKRFAANLAELGNPVPADSTTYLFNTTTQPKQAISTAIAKQDRLTSYIAVVALHKEKGSNQEQPIAIVCETQVPSKVSPAVPQLVQGTFQCPQGSKPVS